ncbi:transcriptional regulator with XRE-family HTH domain [Paenibacillus sp. SORGH_AS306]|uniref:helix-turn-helix domain-containing protein n=1 Tax=unclassified Paenibacillus TaxID=185978 RepID=UPI00277F8156|nr:MULTISPECIES: helix-turn-helix transcriptional regulator [unclassified Paenibacillus]MDQ1233315.1 transcriptional regulator with XRE-family HTH domain [Paenibacillus sp. SORGH_AS_0306]MDR6110357.1 transcriptional regulator with XRE-family HTH domain [Paenibacillus sp. SORGH_AS_0338]
MSVRKTIREWRAFRKLTKTKIASELRIHVSTYTRMEDRPSSVSMEDAVKLSEVFQCEVGNIIFFEENPNFKLELLTTV